MHSCPVCKAASAFPVERGQRGPETTRTRRSSWCECASSGWSLASLAVSWLSAGLRLTPVGTPPRRGSLRPSRSRLVAPKKRCGDGWTPRGFPPIHPATRSDLTGPRTCRWTRRRKAGERVLFPGYASGGSDSGRTRPGSVWEWLPSPSPGRLRSWPHRSVPLWSGLTVHPSNSRLWRLGAPGLPEYRPFRGSQHQRSSRFTTLPCTSVNR